MLRPGIFIKALVLLTTAESHVIVEDSHCTRSSDARSGICKTPKDCPGMERRGSSSRRKSRRFSCLTQKLVCCPFGGGRRASVSRMAYAAAAASHNERCGASAGGAAPDPSGGCCGRQVDVANRIVGGSATGLEQYPWMALLEYHNEQGRRLQITCGGSLVSSRYVLTARHCVVNAQLGSAHVTHVHLAEHDRRTPTDCVAVEGGGSDCVNSTAIEVESVLPHPDQDIALIRLKEPAPYTDFIRPICLPTEDVTKNPPAGLRFSVAGWGLTGGGAPSPVKLHVEVPFVPLDKCEKIFANTKKMRPEDEPICAGGEEGRDSCAGDSGGPLMHTAGERTVAAGVISFGSSHCGGRGTPAVHVNLHRNRRWIRDHMRG